MTQVIDIINAALDHLRVRDADSATPDTDVRDGIAALNRMMRAWEVVGLPLGWTDVAAGENVMPTAPEADEAIAANLALRLRSKYGTSLDPDVVALAQQGESMLRGQVTANTFARTAYPDLPGMTVGRY